MIYRRVNMFYVTIVFILVLSTIVTIETSESIFSKCNHDTVAFNCSGIGLQEIPEESHIPSGTEILDLSSNSISNITLLYYPALEDTLSTLNLSKNQISVLTNDAFKLLTSLVDLDLSRNLIEGKSLEEHMFYDLKRLKVLNMEKNPLRYIKKDTFVFMELPALLRMDLSHCEISDMEAGSIDLPSLEFLDISWNMLSTFSMDAFKMLTNLKTLDMSHNRIHVLSEVPYMPSLDTWILDSNSMEKIEIKEGVENYADNLKNLYLRDNSILRFNEKSFPLELDSLQVIDMSGGNLHCDCRMKWIVSSDYDFTGKNYTFKCGYPSSLKNKDLLGLAPEDLTCGPPLAKILFIVMVSSVALLIVGIISFFVIRRHRQKKQRQAATRRDRGGDYTAVYTREEDDIQMSLSDNKQLLHNDQEFDV